jgi:chemotaxis protein methyltransferase CheR
MTPPLDRAMLHDVAGLIALRQGLHFPEERWPDLARGLESAGVELGFASTAAYVRRLSSEGLSAGQIEALAGHLTVGETSFLRDPESFAVLEREILPGLAARRRDTSRALRLWSAACCTGEEAYSLAISCARSIQDLGSWSVSILGTDLNARFLAKAEAGVYGSWSFRGAPAWLTERYFTAAPDRKLAVDPSIKRLVRFDYLNLAEDVYPTLTTRTNAMDVIFCRNVLMYFTPEHQRRVVAALHRSLVDGGCLFVNPAEANPSLFSMFTMENRDGVLLFRKTSIVEPAESRPVVVVTVRRPPVPTPPERVEASRSLPNASVPPVIDPAARASPPGETPLARARRWANEGRLDDALAVCDAVLATERTSVVAYFLRATVCDELGRIDEAVVALGKVLYLDQDFILAHHALGGLYRRLGKPRLASRHLALARDLLAAHGRDEIVPESDGMTCGRLLESVRSTLEAA